MMEEIMTGVFFDQIVQPKLKGKLYEVVVILVMCMRQYVGLLNISYLEDES